ncbi:hypothetical protein CVT25_011188 [Psilocybe cyanescens]|uniref:Cytochrome P450 n=1 Tax=Psilocybe cyanescens TaxID=93625 RepID=A0A409WGU7_PSICY|nr:hypothetical protein CVT25_011188 [Psilocybe cyanescens]
MSSTIPNSQPTRFIEPIYVFYGLIGNVFCPRSKLCRPHAFCTVYAVYLIIRRLFLWPYLLSPLRNVPGPPLGNPLWGQSPHIIRSETGIPQREWVKKYGPVVRVVGPVGIERMIFMNPEVLHQILVKDWLDYPRPVFLKNILGLVTGHGLLTVTGNAHRQMRKAMNPAFSIPNLMARNLVDIIKTKIENASQPEKGKEILVYDWMSKVTLDIICQTAFGYKADSLHNPHNELAEAYELLLSLQSGPNLARFILLVSLPGGPRFLASDWAYYHRHWLAKVPFLSATSKLVDAMYRIRKLSVQMLKDKMNDSHLFENDTGAKRDIMSILVRARKVELDGGKGDYAMSDRAMMDQVLTFLGAGHETTASGLTWTLWHLSNNLESQRRLRSELAPIFADNPRPDYRTLKDLQWLDCVVMESLRVMPPVPLTVRVAAKTEYIDGVLIPKGTLFWIPIRIVNTWKKIWGEDAEEFNPARWLNLPKDYHPTFSMLSFIAGPHACIGKTMAIIEMKAVLAALIVNFEFEPAYFGQVAKPAAAITISKSTSIFVSSFASVRLFERPITYRWHATSSQEAYLICRVLYHILLWPYLLSPLKNVPGPPLGNPLWGQTSAMVSREAGIPQQEWVAKHGPVVRVVGPVGIERMIFTKPEALHQILVRDWLDYPRPSYLKNILGLVTGYGLLTVTGNDHRQMRKVMNPAFSISNLMAQILEAEINNQEISQNGKEINVYDWMSKVTLDIICETAFGYKADSLHNPENELAKAYELLLSLQTGVNFAGFMVLVSLPGGPRLLASDWAYHHRHWIANIPFLFPTSQLIDAMYRIRKLSARMLEEKMRDSNMVLNDSDAKRDIMSILVRARKAELDGGKGGYAMSDRAMMDQVLTFLGAGHETTASGLTWTLWHLSNNLEYQRRLRDEISPVYAENSRPEYRTLKDLQWLDCVVMESLRLMPPVPVTVREAAKTDYIDGVLVPKGTLLDISIRVVNTWKKIWGEDAEKFNPARWLNLPPNYHHTYSMLSFIAGPHACIGKTMSIIEMKYILAALIVNFEFEPAFAGQVAKPVNAITISESSRVLWYFNRLTAFSWPTEPSDGMPLRVRRVSPL